MSSFGGRRALNWSSYTGVMLYATHTHTHTPYSNTVDISSLSDPCSLCIGEEQGAVRVQITAVTCSGIYTLIFVILWGVLNFLKPSFCEGSKFVVYSALNLCAVFLPTLTASPVFYQTVIGGTEGRLPAACLSAAAMSAMCSYP